MPIFRRTNINMLHIMDDINSVKKRAFVRFKE